MFRLNAGSTPVPSLVAFRPAFMGAVLGPLAGTIVCAIVGTIVGSAMWVPLASAAETSPGPSPKPCAHAKLFVTESQRPQPSGSPSPGEPPCVPRPTPTPTFTSGEDLVPARGFFVGEGSSPVPLVAISSWMLVDPDSGQILAAKDARTLHRPASTLKMLTALTVIPRLDPDSIYVATDEDANENGSRVGLVPGMKYRVKQLLTSMFLVSGNDAAHAVAMANGGVEKTMAQMREVAREVGAVDTTVRNTSGLEEVDPQLTTAQDLALIARAGMRNEQFRAYAAIRESSMPNKPQPSPSPGSSTAGGKVAKVPKTYPIYTTNRLYRFNYPGAIGIKDGYTSKAGRTFVGAATRGGRTLYVVMLNYASPTYDTAKALLDWGFANAGRTKPVGILPDPQGLQSEPGPTPSPLAGASASPSPISSRGIDSSPSPVASPIASAVAQKAGSSSSGLPDTGVLIGSGLALAGGAMALAAGGAWFRRRP